MTRDMLHVQSLRGVGLRGKALIQGLVSHFSPGLLHAAALIRPFGHD